MVLKLPGTRVLLGLILAVAVASFVLGARAISAQATSLSATKTHHRTTRRRSCTAGRHATTRRRRTARRTARGCTRRVRRRTARRTRRTHRTLWAKIALAPVHRSTSNTAKRRTAPGVTLTTEPSSPTSSTIASFAWSTSGAVSGTACSEDGSQYVSCSSGVEYSAGTGSHQFSVKVSNSAGSSTASAQWTVSTASSGAVANTFGRGMFGISAGSTLQNESGSSLMTQDLSNDLNAGARWIRLDINWAQIQYAGSGTYAWGAIDAAVKAAEADGMQVLGDIAYAPAWALPPNPAPYTAPSPSSYAAFASAAVAHYAALGVHAYEIWNEENVNTFWHNPDPAAYTALLKAAYPAIKAADPSATVVLGGLSPGVTDGTNYTPVDFLKAVYADGGAGYFDAVGIHPYCWSAYPGDADNWSAWYQMYGTSTSLRSLMVANGDGSKLIWGTEFGAPTNGPSGSSFVSQSTQAAMITKAYQLWSTYSWAGPLFTYDGRDLGTDTSTIENFFGLSNNDFSPKPAYTAYQQAANSL